MDSSKGGFYALDRWRNDISGIGKLTKKGTGTLKLEGNNTYSGGTRINQGTLEGGSETAFGRGDVSNNRGILKEDVSGKLIIGGDYKQSAKGILELNLSGKHDLLKIKGKAKKKGHYVSIFRTIMYRLTDPQPLPIISVMDPFLQSKPRACQASTK